MYEHVKTGCKHIPLSEQPLQFQSGYFLNKPRILFFTQYCYMFRPLQPSSGRNTRSQKNKREEASPYSGYKIIIKLKIIIPKTD